MRALIVKTSSLGDVVHCLPAVTDLVRALPGTEVDWVVEESFAAIPAMHAAVRRAIPCAVRRWRKRPLARTTRVELAHLRSVLAGERYDAVIDAQGLLKSAIIARFARGTRFGLDWRSSREPLAPFYDRVFAIPRSLHAVERNRLLCAAALGYAASGPPDYGIRAQPCEGTWLPDGSYFVLLHATSAARKRWPDHDWIELGTRLAARGTRAVLPWGSEAERARAVELSAALPGSVVAPKLDIPALAGLLAGARLVIGVDTGLTHLAAALGRPVVGIYGATDPARTGLFATGPVRNLGTTGAFPTVDAVWAAIDALGVLA